MPHQPVKASLPTASLKGKNVSMMIGQQLTTHRAPTATRSSQAVSLPFKTASNVCVKATPLDRARKGSSPLRGRVKVLRCEWFSMCCTFPVGCTIRRQSPFPPHSWDLGSHTNQLLKRCRRRRCRLRWSHV